MILELTKSEQKHIAEISKRYDKLIKQCDKLADAIRPEKLTIPDLPKDSTVEDFEKGDIEADNLTAQYYESGSDEWKALQERSLDLLYQKYEEIGQYRKTLFLQRFKAIVNDAEAVERDAIETVDIVIDANYKQIRAVLDKGDAIRSDIVRAAGDTFYLDAKKVREEIDDAIKANIYALEGHDDALARIETYIDKRIKTDKRIASRKGKLGGWVKPLENETTGEVTVSGYQEHQAVNAKDYVVATRTRGAQKLVENMCTLGLSIAYDEIQTVWLDPPKNSVAMYVSLDFRQMIASGLLDNIPYLTKADWKVYNAIVTLVEAGNHWITYGMIYKYMSFADIDSKSKNTTVPENRRKQIDEALDKFRGILVIKYDGVDKNGKAHSFQYDGALLEFRRVRDKLNGQLIDGLIYIPEDEVMQPALYQWAKFNNNEYDKRPISLRKVPGLKVSDKNEALLDRLYDRVTEMRRDFDQEKKGKYDLYFKERRITFEDLYKEMEVEDMSATEKSRFMNKVEKILTYWKDGDVKLICDYVFIKDKGTHSNRAIEVSFLPDTFDKEREDGILPKEGKTKKAKAK